MFLIKNIFVMKRVKLNLAFFAMLLGLGAAFAFKSPEPKKFASVWRRIATSATKETSNQWVQGAPTGSCLSAAKICSASFPDGYDPNTHSYDDNVMNASSQTLGYRTN
jgi:hypothetical protein